MANRNGLMNLAAVALFAIALSADAEAPAPDCSTFGWDMSPELALCKPARR
jgi:hypothetical protein